MHVTIGQFGIPGVPGAPELLIMFVIMLLYLAIPAAIIVLVVRYVRSRPDEDRIRELEREVAELRGRLEERESDPGEE